MEPSKSWVIFKRYLRGFIAGGLASAATVLPVTIGSLDEAKKIGIIAASAFLSGGILAIEKLVRWVEPKHPVEIDSLPDAPSVTESEE